VLSWANIYLLNLIINKASKAVFIGGYRGLINWHITITVIIITTIAKGVSS